MAPLQRDDHLQLVRSDNLTRRRGDLYDGASQRQRYLSSTSFTPTTVSTYRWIANYSGDANNSVTENTCNAANENVVVAPSHRCHSHAVGGAMIALAAFFGLSAWQGFVGTRCSQHRVFCLCGNESGERLSFVTHIREPRQASLSHRSAPRAPPHAAPKSSQHLWHSPGAVPTRAAMALPSAATTTADPDLPRRGTRPDVITLAPLTSALFDVTRRTIESRKADYRPLSDHALSTDSLNDEPQRRRFGR